MKLKVILVFVFEVIMRRIILMAEMVRNRFSPKKILPQRSRHRSSRFVYAPQRINAVQCITEGVISWQLQFVLRRLSRWLVVNERRRRAISVIRRIETPQGAPSALGATLPTHDVRKPRRLALTQRVVDQINFVLDSANTTCCNVSCKVHNCVCAAS